MNTILFLILLTITIICVPLGLAIAFIAVIEDASRIIEKIGYVICAFGVVTLIIALSQWIIYLFSMINAK